MTQIIGFENAVRAYKMLPLWFRFNIFVKMGLFMEGDRPPEALDSAWDTVLYVTKCDDVMTAQFIDLVKQTVIERENG